MIHSITSIHVCHTPCRTNIHHDVRAPRTADDARVGAERNASHVGHVGSWREEGVTPVEEGWVRMLVVEFRLLRLCMVCRGGEEIGLKAFHTYSGYVMRYKVKR